MARIPVVDHDCCIGCKVRPRICPEVFRREGEDGHGHNHHEHLSVDYNPRGAAEQRGELTMDSCPATYLCGQV